MAYLTDYTTAGQNIIKLLATNLGVAATNDLITAGSDAYKAGVSDAAILDILFSNAAVQGAQPKLGSNFSDTAFVTQLITNIVGPVAVAQATKDAWIATYAAELTAGTHGTTRGAFAVYLDGVFNPTTAPTAGSEAALVQLGLQNRWEGSAYYAQTTGGSTFVSMTQISTPIAKVSDVTSTLDTVTAAPVVTGQTFTLTTGANSFTGTAGNDNFDAGLSSGSLQTLNSGDSLNGGDGTDLLQAVVNGSTTPSSLTGIETIAVTAITNTATVDLTNATGVTSVANQASTSALTLSGISKAVAVTLQDTSTAGQVVSYNDVTGSADAATITLKNVASGAGLTVGGVETLTLHSTGSSTNNLSGTLVSTSTTTLNVTGDKAMTLGALSTSVTTVDGSANTGTGVSATLSSTAASSAVGGAGNDSFTLTNSTLSDSISGGAGNDTITFTTGLSTSDSVDGGDGTDTLKGSSANLVAISGTTPSTYKITNVETVTAVDQIAAASSVNVVNISTAATRFNLANTANTALDAGGGVGVTGPAGTFTVGLGASVAGNTVGQLASTLTVTDTGTAITDAASIKNSASNSTTGLTIDVYNGKNIVSTGYETVTIDTGTAGGATNTIGTITVTGDVGGTTAETVKFTGGNIMTVGVITADVVDGSGLTAASGTLLTMTTGSTARTITGSPLKDVLYGNTTLGSSIDGGAGNDSIVAGSGNDTVLGGDGKDTITSGGGVDNIDGGAGNDKVIATLAAGISIVGGDGTDTLSLAAAATATTATNVSGFETLVGTGALTQDMVQFLGNTTFTTLEADAAAATVNFTNVGSGVTTLDVLAAGTATFARLVDTATSSLDILVPSGVTATAITANDEETLNISADDVTAATITTLTDTDLTTLNITGDGLFTITTLAANSTTAGTLLTINGAANTAGISVDAVSSTTVASVTGSSAAANTLLGGSTGADTIVGGNYADTLKTNGGEDTLTGGAGADTFTVAKTGHASTSATHATSFVTITDFGFSSDIINFGTADIVTDATAATSGKASITAAGVASFNLADSTLALRITAVEASIQTGAAAAGQAAMFNFGSDAYVFISDGADGIGANDLVIKLTGVSVTGHTLTDGGTTFTIV